MSAKKFQLTAMREAIAAGDEHKVRLLLAAGVSPIIDDTDGQTFLADAIVHGHLNLMKLFVNEGADVREPGLLAHALEPGEGRAPSQDIALYLIACMPLPKADLDAALPVAQRLGLDEVAETLIEYGAKPASA